MNEQSNGQPNQQSGERPNQQSNGRSSQQPGERPNQQSNGRPSQQPNGRASQQPGERPNERSNARPNAQPNQHSNGRSSQRPNGRSNARSNGRPKAQAATPGKRSGWRQALNAFVRGDTADPANQPGLEPGATEPGATELGATGPYATETYATGPYATGPGTTELAPRGSQQTLTDQPASPQDTPQSTPQSTPQRNNPLRQFRFPRPASSRRTRTRSSESNESSEPLLEGYEGLDYEVVTTRKGPGTIGAAVVLGLMLLIALFVGLQVFNWFKEKLDPPGDPTTEIIVALPPGSSSAAVSKLLADNAVIPDATAYEWYVRLRGGPTFQAGDYVFQENSSVWEALDVLEGGPTQVEQAEQFALTFPEGLTVTQIADVIDTQVDLGFSGADLLAALEQTPAHSTIAPPPDGIADVAINLSEGLLFGDTYFVTPSTPLEQVIERMSNQMDTVLSDLGYENAIAAVGLTPYEALIVASIVEGEASRPEDRPKLAQVIYNRIAAGMTLGMDATVRYLVDGADVDAAALAIDSPYNTRLNVGLPPTPISSPSRGSLEAALNPEPGDWLFVVKTAEDGTLSFSVEYEQFLRDKEVCQELGFCG